MKRHNDTDKNQNDENNWSKGDTFDDFRPEPNTGLPGWVRVFGVIVILLVLLFVILHLTGGGFGGHGS